ncbi:MAG: ATP-binding cassette domain-containing protein [Flavobacteriales bacterium]|nr:ATP-binding cassette domain-containing protein [Flavobacteriales bacterium]
MNHILKTLDLKFSYSDNEVLNFPNFSVAKGEHSLISGNSGVGKTTLLHLIGGLLTVSDGEIWVSGLSLSSLSKRELDEFRGKNIGFVFQQPSFIRSLNVQQNIEAAQYFGKGTINKEKAIHLLKKLGLEKYRKRGTYELSGGERQRLAIARALSISPEILLADEPTSSLDDSNAFNVYELLVTEADANGATLIVVTHDNRLKAQFKNCLEL